MPSYLLSSLMTLWLTVGSALTNLSSEWNPEQINVDVFTTSSQPIDPLPGANYRKEVLTIGIHQLDGVARFTRELSAGLGRDPDLSKRQVLQRFKTVDKAERDTLQRSAEALALALQLKVQRYPAIVFDRQWVIYGVLNVQRAIILYRASRLDERQ